MCCWYLLLWNIIFIILAIYAFFISGLVSSNGYAGGLLIIALTTLAAGKPLISLKFIRHLKNKTLFTEVEVTVFIAGLVLCLTEFLFVGYFFLYQLAGYSQDDNKSLVDALILLSTILFFATTFYMMILDFPLKNAISKQTLEK